MSFPVIKIEFHKTNSVNYNSAIAIFQKFENYTLIDRLNSLSFDLNNPPFDLEIIEYYINVISKWKNTKFFLGNILSNKFHIKKLFDIYKCCMSYNNSVNKETHCFIDSFEGIEGWGCKFIKDIKRHLPKSLHEMNSYYMSKFWFEYGEFKNNTWVIQKDLIRNKLIEEINLSGVIYCPYFNQNKLENFINILPDSIDPKINKDWEYIEKLSDNGFTKEMRIIGVKPYGLSYSYGMIDTRQLVESFLQESGNERNARNVPNVQFSDIGGLGKTLEEIRYFIELPIKEPQLFAHLNVKPHKGILLSGLPGCGKTLIAKAIANEINAHFIAINSPELLSCFHGQSESNLRDVFREASYHAPSIIFFDEFDSIAGKRTGHETIRIDNSLVNQLLTLLDGFNSDDNVRVIAATNRPELIDSAIKRQGRFDYHLEISPPDLQGCKEILNIHLKNRPVDKKFDIDNFSKKLIGYSGADIAFIVNEAACYCIKRCLDVKSVLNNKDINYNTVIIRGIDFEDALKKLKHRNNIETE